MIMADKKAVFLVCCCSQCVAAHQVVSVLEGRNITVSDTFLHLCTCPTMGQLDSESHMLLPSPPTSSGNLQAT